MGNLYGVYSTCPVKKLRYSVIVDQSRLSDCKIRGSNPGRGKNLKRDFCFMRTSAPSLQSGTTTSGTRASPKPGNSPFTTTCGRPQEERSGSCGQGRRSKTWLQQKLPGQPDMHNEFPMWHGHVVGAKNPGPIPVKSAKHFLYPKITKDNNLFTKTSQTI